jgi:cytochrome c oxidase subunit IV
MAHTETTIPAAARRTNEVRTYAVIWALLMLLTAITVATAEARIGKLAIVVCLAIASLKSILVFLYFMHLRHEKRLLIKLVVPIALITLSIFIGLTFFDVVFR